MKTLIQTSKVLILSITVLTAVLYVQAAWTNPTQAPTGGNTVAPINVSNSNQDKTGGFSAASLLSDKVTAVNEICLGGDCIDTWPGGGDNVDLSNYQKRVIGTCDGGQFITEINEDGTVQCDRSSSEFVSVSCPDGQAISGINSAGDVSCVSVGSNNGDGGNSYSVNCTDASSCSATCRSGYAMTSWICTHNSTSQLSKSVSGATGRCSIPPNINSLVHVSGYGTCTQ